MNKSRSRFLRLEITVLLLIASANGARGSELTVQIRSPKDGSEITQDQSYVLIGGKVASKTGGSGYVDIFLVLDVSGSTAHRRAVLSKLARQRTTGATTLARIWLAERLERELKAG